MRKRYHRGFFAEQYLKNKKQNDANGALACGHFIEKLDYFEQERLNKIREFNTSDIEDDIYAVAHREELS